MKSRFAYRGGEIFQYRGDDDLWYDFFTEFSTEFLYFTIFLNNNKNKK